MGENFHMAYIYLTKGFHRLSVKNYESILKGQYNQVEQKTLTVYKD